MLSQGSNAISSVWRTDRVMLRYKPPRGKLFRTPEKGGEVPYFSRITKNGSKLLKELR